MALSVNPCPKQNCPVVESEKKSMANFYRQVFYALLLMIVFGCGKIRLPLSKMDKDIFKAPTIRVGLLQQKDVVEFMVNGSFSIYDSQGKFVARGLQGNRWQARVVFGIPGEVEYRLKFVTTDTYRDAVESSRFLAERNIRFELLEDEHGATKDHIATQSNRQAKYHVVLWQIFRDREEAEKMRQRLVAKAPLEVFEYVKAPPGGKIEITNLETGKSLEVPSGARLDTERFALFDVPVGEGFHWQENEDRVYRGLLEFMIDKDKKITVVNNIPVESYLRGVVPSEMPKEFSIEALKAQAIAARGEVLKKIARHNEDGFDICANVHCQVYSGIGGEAERTNRAILETAGLVLMRDGQVADAVYHGVCGGHTENNENVWDGKPQSHLRGIFDGDGAPDLLGNYLKQEATLRKWVSTFAPVYCNTVDSDVPVSLEYTRKYFRWSTEIPRLDLEHYIKAETGENFGSLLDIIPLERGVSGRLRRIRIIGTLKSFEIEKELTIRRALSATTLFSAGFFVEKKSIAVNGGLPQAFAFRGAGWGHGVGMCQTGAAMMALNGFRFHDIIQHYYNGIEIGKAY
jgi:SpoIID/LytB domain protein